MIKVKCSQENFENCTGVYIFKNKINGKCYIGSTVMSFKKRFNHHVYHLRENKHKNSHFQNAWNKYGEDSFEFNILEICPKDKCLEREQYHLDTLLFAQEYINKKSDKFLKLGYNINPLSTGTPNLSKETIEKRSKTYKEFVNTASEYYHKLKSFEIDFDDIPHKYLEIIYYWFNHIPWNKGKHYESTDHLKVPKTITEEFKKARKDVGDLIRSRSKNILVFDINKKYLGTWRSPADLHEWSLSPENDYPLILKGKSKTNELLAQNLAKSCKTGKPYKGLYFEYEDSARLESDFKNEANKYGEVWNDNTVLTYSISKGE